MLKYRTGQSIETNQQGYRERNEVPWHKENVDVFVQKLTSENKRNFKKYTNKSETQKTHEYQTEAGRNARASGSRTSDFDPQEGHLAKVRAERE